MLNEYPNFSCKGLRATAADIRLTKKEIEKVQCYPDDFIDSQTLVYILPFTYAVNSVICSTLETLGGRVYWRLCLSALSLLVPGLIDSKLRLIEELHDFVDPSTLTVKSVLRDSLSNAQRISAALNQNGRAAKEAFATELTSHDFECYNLHLSLEKLANALLVSAQSSADLDFSKPLSFNWTSITDQPSLSPCARSKLAACVCGHKIYLLGGRDGKFSAGDFWCFDTVTDCWSRLHMDGDSPPSYIEEHTMISYHTRVYVFGGVTRLADNNRCPLWIFDTAMGSWTHWQSLGEVTLPPCLIGHSAVLFNKNMYVFGGIDDLTGPSDFLWTFDLREDQWHLVYGRYSKKCGPGARHNHSATLHENMMFIIGGINSLQIYNDTWLYNFDTSSWTKIKPAANIPGLYGHTATKLGDSIFILGGKSLSGISKTMWEYKIPLKNFKARPKLLRGGPTPRCFHASLVVSPGSFMLPITEQVFPKLSVLNDKPDILSDITSVEPSQIFGQPTNAYSDINHNNARPNYFSDNHRDTAATDTKSLYSSANLLCDSVIYSRSIECLLKRSSIYSDRLQTFDNPAYQSSQELLASNCTGDVTVTDIGVPSHARQTSRSLDSLRLPARLNLPSEVVLPGSVPPPISPVSNSGTFTPRNVIIDDNRNKQLSNSDSFQKSVDCTSYQWYILGGDEQDRHRIECEPLALWRCHVFNEDCVRVKTKKPVKPS